MSTTVTETAEYSNATLPTRPQDGETIYMDAGAAPQWPLWARLYNRTAHHEALLLGMMSWSGDFAVDSGGSNSSFTVRIGVIAGVNLYNASASVVKSYAGGTIGASKISGGGNLSNSTWYYVYAYLNSGSIDFEISTTAPAGSKLVKNGDASRVYLGCFPTTSAGAPIPLRAVRGRYVYNFSGSAVADTRVLNAGNATSNTAVDLAGLVPPHSRMATLRAEAVSTTGSANNNAFIRTEGESGADEIAVPVPSINLASTMLVLDVLTDADQDVAYRVSNFTSAPTLTLFVHGFYE
jgi:hypothetical protein